MTSRELGHAVRAELDQPHRYGHTLRVARLAASLARTHGEDAAAAREAGLLHDIARLRTTSELLRECERRAMPIDAFERANPIVLHARLGARLAHERFGTTNERVLEAIRAHTLGAPALSPLAQIVYLADALEPGRTFDGREAQLRLAREDLDAATYAVLVSTAAYLRGRGLRVAPQTQAAIEWYGAPANSTGRATAAPATKERSLCVI